MSTFTKEQLIAKAQEQIKLTRGLNLTLSAKEHADMCSALFEIALASLEAEAVHQVLTGDAWVDLSKGAMDSQKRVGAIVRTLYAAPPSPVSVPDEVLNRLEHEANTVTAWHHMDEHSCKVNRRDLLALVNACRAAMLQGADTEPMQPLVIDAHGTLRFKENHIVRALLDYSTEHGYGLNEIAMEGFDAEDQMQLAQLIGYSLSGYGTLSYVTDESYERAAAAAPQQEVKP